MKCKIRPSLTTSPDRLQTINIHLETTEMPDARVRIDLDYYNENNPVYRIYVIKLTIYSIILDLYLKDS